MFNINEDTQITEEILENLQLNIDGMQRFTDVSSVWKKSELIRLLAILVPKFKEVLKENAELEIAARHGEDLQAEVEQLQRDINTLEGYEKAKDIANQIQFEKIQSLTRELASTKAQLSIATIDIPHKCITCGKRIGWDPCKDADFSENAGLCRNWEYQCRPIK